MESINTVEAEEDFTQCAVYHFGKRPSFENNAKKNASFNMALVLSVIGLSNGNISFLTQNDHRCVKDITVRAKEIFNAEFKHGNAIKCKSVATELCSKNLAVYSAMLELYTLWHKDDPRKRFDPNSFLLAFLCVAFAIEKSEFFSAKAQNERANADSFEKFPVFSRMKFHALDVDVNVFYTLAMGLRESDEDLISNDTDACRLRYDWKLRCCIASTYRSDPKSSHQYLSKIKLRSIDDLKKALSKETISSASNDRLQNVQSRGA